jgi:two-component system NtrC family sensor kinase
MLVVGVILLAAVALLLLHTAGTHERQLLSHAVLHTGRMSDIAARSIRPQMLAHRRAEILSVFDGYAQEDGLEKIRLFDKDGSIVLSTDRSEINDTVDMTHEMCIQCHADGPPQVLRPPLERGRIFATPDGSRRLAIITPIYNAPPCYDCHDRDQQVLGVLDAVFSLRTVDASIVSVRRAALLSGSAAVLLAWVAVALVMQRFVRTPVTRLLRGTERVSRGDLDVEIPVSSHDEIGQLCSAFNAMSTQLRKAAAEHARWNGELESRIKTATKALEAANEGLRDADRRRAEFIRTSVHQLRAPVSGMQSFLRLITRQIVGDLSPKQRETLDRVDRKCGLLLATVNDLLDMAAISENRLDRPAESVDVGAVAGRSVEQFSHLAEKKRIDLHLECHPALPRVVAAPRDVEYALSNLLSNAIHYTNQGSVTLTVGPGDQSVVLTVCDTGIGIPEDDLPHCFREFYRGNNVAQHYYEGTGLGLAIVKKVVEKYGGDIRLETSLGSGAARILVIDDDPDFLEITTTILESKQYDVRCATNLDEGLARLEEGIPDLIILDIMMRKGAEGIVMSRRLRKDPRYAPIPILMLTSMPEQTGFDFPGEPKHPTYLPVDDYAEKPIEPQDLLEKVERLLAQASSNST